MKLFSFILLFFCCVTQSKSQDTIPVLKGNITISIEKGTMACDFTLSNMPNIEDYVIRINSGMNILYFKNKASGNLLYFDRDRSDSTSFGESIAYYFGGARKFLPKEVEMRYVGMFPVIDTAKDTMVEDWRGNIAFVGKTLRADGHQSAWYPILFDMKKQILYQKVKYDVQVNCSDCKTLYVNGNKPITGQSINFKSETPQELLLYCGNYDFKNIGNTYVLNGKMTNTQLNEFGNLVNGFKQYYESKLKLKYNGDITFINTIPTAKKYGFLFVSYPTITSVSSQASGLNRFTDIKTSAFYRPYVAHELGHYYFGELLRTNSEFGPVFNEGFTEYLAFKLTKDVISDSLYKVNVAKKIKSLKDFKAKAFAQLKTQNDFNNRELYVYYYVPIILSAVEQELGEKKMWEWLNEVILSKTDFTNYEFLKRTLAKSVVDKKLYNHILTNYFETDESLLNAIKKISTQ